jgi:hypothetical protein
MTDRQLTDDQIKAAAQEAGLEYAALKAVALMEAAGAGFLPDGQRRCPLSHKAGDWPKFALGYNGAGYAQNQYDKRLAAEYAKARRKEE